MASVYQYCNLSGCDCKTENGDEYCSDYCRQAARHAPERDYCQCGHGSCASPIPLERALFQYQLSEAIFLSPGQVTIHCTTVEQLCQQVEFLAKALLERSDELRKRVEPGPLRRPVKSEIQAPMATAKSA
jgi:hypothetical protein